MPAAADSGDGITADSESGRCDTSRTMYDRIPSPATADARPTGTGRSQYGHDLNNGLRRISGVSL